MRKKRSNWILPIILMGMLFMLTNSCEKDDINKNSTGQIPVLTTTAVSIIAQTTASCGGNITSDGGATVTARGVCWSTNQTPTIADIKTIDGSGTGSFTSNITELTAETIYYIRAYATNSAGTGYGSVISFTTLDGSTETVTDYDGNVYHTITIGTQIWLVENLKVTHYRNGDPIPNITNNTAWSDLTTGAYCNYNNDENNATTYGRLYNWFTVNDSRNIAPTGWHIPTDAEWTTLINYLGDKSIAGGKLKETGTTHWNSPNTDASNETGFTALPGGYCNYDGSFNEIGNYGYWWSVTENDATYAWTIGMDYSSSIVSRYFDYKKLGISVRCIKD